MNNSISASAPLDHAPSPSRGDWHVFTGSVGTLLHKLAAPTFALMALVSGLTEHAAPITCAAIAHMGHFGGMTAMYVLMAFFHVSAWLPRGGSADLQSTCRSQS